MKQQVIEDVNIMPQLERACGLDMHKDKIVGLISGKVTHNFISRKLNMLTTKWFSFFLPQVSVFR